MLENTFTYFKNKYTLYSSLDTYQIILPSHVFGY